MGFLSKLFGHGSETKGAKLTAGNDRKDTGAIPRIAAQSKEPDAPCQCGQNP